ncbi:alpha/beta fold hydrolase [Sphingomonas nostoxanthinifaciens]|uniref:alpha/beta fold hydrolase n=1 Tax=Sphingomonas nostoxanthinifaciens TaxID=2872652 RepID=UPI001CC1DE75|nr:alpha/beta fold hydrolase [Sphingomonas nostoxanthinifaciens]
MRAALTLAAWALLSATAIAAPPEMLPPNMDAVTSDTAVDTAHPAAMVAFRLPSHGALLNAVLYTPSGGEAHATLLLLHGLPGNEQNLDLAQAARRAGWNVLTFHYRGSWGSPGVFSFANCAEDAAAALAWLRDPANVQKYHLKADRIVVAGHSMGGAMAARVAAADKDVAGVLLIDPFDLAGTGRGFADPAKRQAFDAGELHDDMPPLAGTSEDTLLDEIARADPAFDLAANARALADRPLMVIGAERGIAAQGIAAADAARAAGAPWVTSLTMPTDHSFSDHRIALETEVLKWLWTVPGRSVSFTGTAWQPDNIFAKMTRGEVKVATVYEDKYVLAFMGNHPESIGHVLVISKVAHARNIMEIPPVELNRVMAVARRVAIAERAVLHPQGVVIQQNNGNAQSIPHLHVHVYPSYAVSPWLTTPAPMAEFTDLQAVAAKLRAAMPQ